MPPQRLKNVAICFSGTFGDSTPDKLRRWTEHAGGTYIRQFDASIVTHLIVSETNWKNCVPEVKAARKDKHIKILNYEWFDDKLRTTTRVTDSKYDWRRQEEEATRAAEKHQKKLEKEAKKKLKEEERKKKDAEKINYSEALLQHTNAVLGYDSDDDEDDSDSGSGLSQSERFIQGAIKAKKDLNSNNYVVYRDQTGFNYDITISRASSDLMRTETIYMTIYETITIPHSYACVIRASVKDLLDMTKYTTIQGTTYAVAFRAFRKNFQTFTGVAWEDRLSSFRTNTQSTPTTNDTASASASNIATSSRPTKVAACYNRTSLVGSKAQKSKAAAKAQGKNAKPDEPLTPAQKKQALEVAFSKMKFTYLIPGPNEPRGMQQGYSLSQQRWAEQEDVPVYRLFGATKDTVKNGVGKGVIGVAKGNDNHRGVSKVLGEKLVLGGVEGVRIRATALQTRGAADAPIVFGDSDEESDVGSDAGSDTGSDTENDDDEDEDAMQGVENSTDFVASSRRPPTSGTVSLRHPPKQMEIIEIDDDDDDEEEEDDEYEGYQGDDATVGAEDNTITQDWTMVDVV